ncbi:hypothetical protein N9204_00280 [bacterium]|nr:hypothetical protein [bacterium]
MTKSSKTSPDRAILEAEKRSVDNALNKAKSRLNFIKRQGSQGNFSKPEDLLDLENEIADLKTRSQFLQGEIAKAKRTGKSRSEHFVEAASDILPAAQFNAIMSDAMARKEANERELCTH